jgi:hypothetical protein
VLKDVEAAPGVVLHTLFNRKLADVLDYGPCLAEHVPAALQPFMFTDADGLAARLGELLNGAKLGALHAAMAAENGPSWSEEWRRVALPIIAFTDRTSV